MNIEEYKFSSDSAYALVYQKGEVVVVYDDARDNHIWLTKTDVIALCQHFKLTADEIKEQPCTTIMKEK